MNVRIHSIHFDADNKLLSYTEVRCRKVARYFDRVISAEVFLAFSKNLPDNKNVEIKLKVSKKVLVSRSKSNTFENAVSNCLDNLIRQVQKHKEKLRDL